MALVVTTVLPHSAAFIIGVHVPPKCEDLTQRLHQDFPTSSLFQASLNLPRTSPVCLPPLACRHFSCLPWTHLQFLLNPYFLQGEVPIRFIFLLPVFSSNNEEVLIHCQDEKGVHSSTSPIADFQWIPSLGRSVQLFVNINMNIWNLQHIPELISVVLPDQTKK